MEVIDPSLVHRSFSRASLQPVVRRVVIGAASEPTDRGILLLNGAAQPPHQAPASCLPTMMRRFRRNVTSPPLPAT